MGSFRGRPSKRERISASNAWSRFYAAASERPDAIERTERDLITPLAPKRDKVLRPSDRKPAMPLEKHVLASVLEALRHDPRVWIVDRRQSGVFQEGDRHIRVGTRGVLDISGMLKNGRYYEIECKRPGEKPDERQMRRIEHIIEGGGISGCCWSIESALALLDDAPDETPFDKAPI